VQSYLRVWILIQEVCLFFFYCNLHISDFEIIVISLTVDVLLKIVTLYLMKLANRGSFFYWYFFACHESIARRSLWCNSFCVTSIDDFIRLFYFIRLYKTECVSLCQYFIVLFSLEQVSEECIIYRHDDISFELLTVFSVQKNRRKFHPPIPYDENKIY